MSCVGGFCPSNQKSLPLLFHVSTHFAKAWGHSSIKYSSTIHDEELVVYLGFNEEFKSFDTQHHLPSTVNAQNCAVHFCAYHLEDC